MNVNLNPLLSIAIPTWNRAVYLTETLAQLAAELKFTDPLAVEIFVSDNASTDDTQDVVEYWIKAGLSVKYKKNAENIGSDANIAQCFNSAKGKYVLILGDDDVFVDGALKSLLDLLRENEFGVVCMRSYGFNHSFRKEFPGGGGGPIIYDKVDEFFQKTGPFITLISVCVINKQLLRGVDASIFCGSNLVQVHLVARAAISANHNIFFNKYLIACKRNNSGGYNFAKVFVENFFGIMGSYKGDAFTTRGLSKLESRLMRSFYPFYLYKSRLQKKDEIELKSDRLIYSSRFKGRWEYEIVLRPILCWPRPLAIIWGGLMTTIGRIAYGDLRRGVAFLINKFKGI